MRSVKVLRLDAKLLQFGKLLKIIFIGKIGENRISDDFADVGDAVDPEWLQKEP